MNIRAIQTSYALQWGIIGGAFGGGIPDLIFVRWILIIAVGLCLLYWFCQKNILLYGMVFCLSMAVMSSWTGYSLEAYRDLQESLPESFQEVIVEIRSFPRTRSLGYQYNVSLEDGTFLYLTSSQPDLEWGDLLEISGRVSIPEEPGIQRYLLGQNVHGYIIDLSAQRFSERCGILCSLIRIIHQFRRIGLYLIGSLYPGSEGQFLQSILLGYSDLLPEEIEQSFRASGIRHILAISGYHMSLVVVILYQGLRKLSWSRARVIPLTIVGIGVFIVITGASPSTIRAGVLALILLLAEWSQRYVAGMRPLVLTAALMMIVSPLIGLYNLGFQLSFLAVIGILIFSDALTTFSQGMAAVTIRDMIGETVAAQLMVTPLLLVTFGEVSLISIIGNLLIIPLIPLIMLGGVISVILYAIFPVAVIGYPVNLLISFLLELTEWFGNWSFALLKIAYFPWWGAVLGYLLIGVLWGMMQFVQKRDRMKQEGF